MSLTSLRENNVLYLYVPGALCYKAEEEDVC